MPQALSPITARAVGVRGRSPARGRDLGRSLADETGDPDRFAPALRDGLAALADLSTSPASGGSRPGSVTCMAFAGR